MKNDLGVALLPSIDGNPVVSMKSSLVLAFPNQSLSSEKQAALRKFSQYIQSEAFLRKVHKGIHSLPANEKIKNKILSHSNKNYRVLVQQLQKSKPMPSSILMVSSWDAISQGLGIFLDEGVEAKTAAGFMQRSAAYEKRRILSR